MLEKKLTKEELEALKKKHSDINVPDEDIKSDESFKEKLKEATDRKAKK